VPGRILLFRPHVHNNNLTASHAIQELPSVYRLHAVYAVEIIADQTVHFGKPLFSQTSQRSVDGENFPVGKAVKYLKALLPGRNQT
jgi:hypothetical protein